MRDKSFEELKKSIEQGGKILKGKRKPGREFNFDNPDPKEIRERLGLSQNKFAKLLGINASKLGTGKKKTRWASKGFAKCCFQISGCGIKYSL